MLPESIYAEAIHAIVWLAQTGGYVTVRLFSNITLETSKCGKNTSGTLDYCLMCHGLVATTF